MLVTFNTLEELKQQIVEAGDFSEDIIDTIDELGWERRFDGHISWVADCDGRTLYREPQGLMYIEPPEAREIHKTRSSALSAASIYSERWGCSIRERFEQSDHLYLTEHYKFSGDGIPGFEWEGALRIIVAYEPNQNEDVGFFAFQYDI